MNQTNIIEAEVVVIGAGVSGLTCARQLHDEGVDVLVLEKARGTGGRLASKRLQVDGTNISFDLGASYFHASSDVFLNQLQVLTSQGVTQAIANTPARNDSTLDASKADALVSDAGGAQWVGVPRNSALTRHLSNDLNVIFSEKVSHIEFDGSYWSIFSQTQQNKPQPQVPSHVHATLIARCKQLVLSAPAEQSHELLPKEHKGKPHLQGVLSEPVFVSTLVTEALSEPQILSLNKLSTFEGIELVSLEHAKPQRECGEHHVIKIQSSYQWAKDNLEQDKEIIADKLQRSLESYLGEALNVQASYTHRWLYSEYLNPLEDTSGYLSFSDGLHLCGDYFHQKNQQGHIRGVERAHASGKAIGASLVRTLFNAKTKSLES